MGRQRHTSILDSGYRIQSALEVGRMRNIEAWQEALSGNPGCMQVMKTVAKAKVIEMKKEQLSRTTTLEILRQ